MKISRYILPLFLSVCTVALGQQNSVTTAIEVNASLQGSVRIGVFDNAEAFPTQGRQIAKASIKVNKDLISYTFTDLNPGKYAIAVYHDVNADKLLNKNMFGVPKEGYGFSNNVFGILGPPDFDEASFVLHKQDTLNFTIKLKY